MRDRVHAEIANGQGMRFQDEGDDQRAEQKYLRAVDLDPSYREPWFNLGLVYKRRGDWAASARCNERAAELDPRPEQPAWWNLGIAATALRDWPVARRAWRSYGVALPEGEGPIELNFGPVPIRLNPGGAEEVVWCRRIDPARAVIKSIPLPDSGHRFHDIVLHDGEPKGEREIAGRTVHVFNELERWQESSVPTVVAQLTCPTHADSEAVEELCAAAGLEMEDWTGNIEPLCKACSEGRPHEVHDHDGQKAWRALRWFGFAGELAQVGDVLERWRTAGGDRAFTGLERAL
jgi:TPR repeat